MALTKVQNTGIADDAVTTDKIENSTVLAADIAPGTITNAKLSNSAVTLNGSSVSLGGSATLKHIEWQALTVADGSTTLTAEAGKGYFLDTNAGVIEVFLPSSPTRGDTIVLADYSGTFGTNHIIINTGGQLIDSTSGPDFKVDTDNSIVELVYVDSNKGYLVKLNQAAGTAGTVVSQGGIYDNPFIVATGGTITTDGNFKIHKFTGDGCFVVSATGRGTQEAPNTVDYLVVAGGGAGGGYNSTNEGLGGGGAGGFRESLAASSPVHTPSGHTASPLKATTGIVLTASTFPVTVGGGGARVDVCTTNPAPGNNGSNSVFSTITSTGGGGGGSAGNNGKDGGSGGGGARGNVTTHPGGSGNTPPVSPSQGNDGGIGTPQPCTGTPAPVNSRNGGGGGGAGGAGQAGVGDGGPSPTRGSGDGGAHVNSSFDGTDREYAGGGGGAGGQPAQGAGGGGGGGAGSRGSNGQDATANTGGGGGGGNNTATPGGAGNGGKGIVIIKYKFQ